MPTSLVCWNDKLDRTVPRVSEFTYTLTSGAMVPREGYPILAATGALTQATIDAFLGTSTEVNYLNYDATSLGTDALGFIVDMGGQVKKLISFEVIMRSGTGFVTTVRRYATTDDVMVNTSIAVAEAALSTTGNPYCRFVVTSFDSTTGYIDLRMKWISK